MLKLCRNSRGTTFRNPFQSELECHLLEVEIQEVCWRKLNDIVLSTEGVQLLCLIDKGLDACRYLQTYGEWDSAAWLAKVKLHFLSRYKCLFSASLVSLQKSIFVETFIIIIIIIIIVFLTHSIMIISGNLKLPRLCWSYEKMGRTPLQYTHKSTGNITVFAYLDARWISPDICKHLQFCYQRVCSSMHQFSKSSLFQALCKFRSPSSCSDASR